MTPRSPQTKRPRPRRGAALVEMAVVFPVLLLIVMGMVEMGRLGMVSQLVTTAAREGCRVAVLNGQTQANVEARIETVLESGGVADYEVAYTPSNWASVKASDTTNFVSVSVTVNYSDVSWLPVPWFLDGKQIVGSATLSSERQ